MSISVLFTLFQMSVALGGLSASATLLVLGLNKNDRQLMGKALIFFFITCGSLMILGTMAFFIELMW